jgi:hypothetical protein
MNHAFGVIFLKIVRIYVIVLDPLNVEYREQGTELLTYLCVLRMTCVFLDLTYRLRVNRSTDQ